MSEKTNKSVFTQVNGEIKCSKICFSAGKHFFFKGLSMLFTNPAYNTINSVPLASREKNKNTIIGLSRLQLDSPSF